MTVTLDRRPECVLEFTTPDTGTPAAARHGGHDYLTALGAPAGDIDLVDLILSELVTNAVLHGAGPVEIRLGANGVGYEMEVRDRGRKPVPAPHASCSDDECGRGWEIVQALTGRPPRVEHDQTGTRVSAVLNYSALEEAA